MRQISGRPQEGNFLPLSFSSIRNLLNTYMLHLPIQTVVEPQTFHLNAFAATFMSCDFADSLAANFA